MSNNAMSNETDLDWLARNVHVWLEGKREVLVFWPRNVDTLIWSYGLSDTGWITKDQWLARRAELQNKPSWKDWPQWDFMAQNKNGCWIVSNRELIAGEDGRWHGYGAVTSRGTGEVLGDWRDTLERRPVDTVQLEQPDVVTGAGGSIQGKCPNCGNAGIHACLGRKVTHTYASNEIAEWVTKQQAKEANNWFERGELPPVGIAVQLWHGGTYAYDCELIAKRGNDFVLWNLTWARPDSADCMMCVFKPTPTEREELADLIESHGQMSALVVADAILAAGFSLRDK